MRQYKVQRGESPARIARAFGIPFNSLIAANPHKPRAVVAGQTTWRGIAPGETINVPVGVGANDALIATINQLVAQGGPCLEKNALLVCAIQNMLGVTIDGKWGNDASTAARKIAPNAPAGCSPRPTWWTPKGQSNCPSTAPATTAKATTASDSSALQRAASAAMAALTADANYCTSVKRAGTPVNTAVHNFKAAWNAANPGSPVPIGTGNYEPSVAAALQSILGGVVPSGCGAATSAPAPSPVSTPTTPPPPTPPPPPAPTASGGYTSAQIAAATAMNSALTAHGYKSSDQPLYRAFQSAMGSTPDGFPGTGTMGKLQAVLSSAGIAMAPVKVYPWKAGAYDGKNAPTSAEWNGKPATPAQSSAAGTSTAKQAEKSATTAADTAKAAAASGNQAAADKAAADAQAAATAAKAAAAQVTDPNQAATAKAAADTAQAAADTAKAAAGGAITTTGEEKKGISKGAIIAGAIGAAALVGIAVMAASSKKGHRGARGRRGPSGRRPSHHKAKKKSHKKRK